MSRFRSIAPDNKNIFVNLLNTDCHNDKLRGKVKSVICVVKESEESNPLSYLMSQGNNQQLNKIDQFNRRGQQVSYHEIYDDNIIFKLIEYVYDENRNLITITIIDEDENIDSKIEFTYNNKDQIIKEYRKQSDELFMATYNSKGYLIKVDYKSVLQGYGEKHYKIIRESNNPNNIIEIREGDYLKTKFKYDENGNIVIIQNFQGVNEFHSSEEIMYDDFNNEIKRIYINNRRTTVFEHDYIYDEMNNWINSSFYVDGELDSKSTRVIEYYN